MSPPGAEQTWTEWIQWWPTQGLMIAKEDKPAAS